MHARLTKVLSAVFALGAAAVATGASADDVAGAKALFDRGLDDMERGDFDTGCPAIEASEKLDPRPGTLFTLAECESKRGRIATAVTLYDNYLSQIALLSPDKQALQQERKTIAIEQKAALLPGVPALTLVLPTGAPSSLVVKRDGVEVLPAAIGVALPVDPGDHVLSTEADGKQGEVHVSIAKGEKKTVTLPIPSSTPRPSAQRIGAFVAAGVGGAALVVGAVLGGLTIAKKTIINQHCNFPGDKNACDPTGLAAASTAKPLGIGASVAFGVAAAGAATAVVLFFTEPKHAPAANAAFTGGILSAGRDGAALGLWGTW